MEKKNQIPKYPHLRFPEFTDEWKEVKLGEVLSFEVGYPFSSDAFNEEGNGVRLIKNRDLKADDRVVFYGGEYDAQYIVQNGDILIGMDGDFSPCLWKKGKALLNQRVGRVNANQNTSRVFILYVLVDSLKKIEHKTSSTTVKHLSHKDVEKIKASLPSLAEQKKIAALFSLIDERIEVQNAIIKEQEALKASLLRRLFDRTLRFPEFTDEWKEYQNSEVFEIISEKNTDLKYSNVVSASMNHGVVLRDEIGIDIKYEQENIRGYKVVRDGDYIVHLRSFQGGFAFSRLNGICSPAYTILRPRPNMLEYGFLEAYFYSSRFITSLKQVTYGIRDGRSISIGEWMQEKTSLPSLPEQRKIADLLSAVDELIAVEKEYATLLQKQKAYLLRQMFV